MSVGNRELEEERECVSNSFLIPGIIRADKLMNFYRLYDIHMRYISFLSSEWWEFGKDFKELAKGYSK
jgi:hypothetical protein